MICPQCNTEYRDGFYTCSDCGVALVGSWVGKTPDAAPETSDQLVPLAHEGSPELVAEVLDRLEQAGIPYVIQAGTAMALFEGEAVSPEKPLPWEARVWVVETFAERATAILHEVRGDMREEAQRSILERYGQITRS